MKCIKMMTVAVCGALAIAGCKYDDDEATDAAANASGSDLAAMNAAGANVAGANAAGADVAAVNNMDGAPGTMLPFDQDPNFMRCTDVDLVPVYFGFDASNLGSSELAKIEAAAQHLKDHPGRVVMIEGNCDERGSNEYNLSLGDLRANAIRDYMATLGVAAERIQTKSYGEEKPAVSGSGESAWAKNRRGEFAIFRHR